MSQAEHANENKKILIAKAIFFMKNLFESRKIVTALICSHTSEFKKLFENP